MSEAAPTLIYLEADDEITSVVRRIRQAEPGRVVVVAPGRSRATSSVVALRLLARAGGTEDRDIAIVGDALTRSLAGEAGLRAYGSVDDARRADPAAPVSPTEVHHAAIHVVRGAALPDAPTVAIAAVVGDAPPASSPAADADAETRPVPVVRRPPAPSRPRPVPSTARRRPGMPRSPLVPFLAALALLLTGGGVLSATVLPAATIRIVPRTDAVGPVEYIVMVADAERLRGTVEETAEITATGTYPIQVAATGEVVFYNWNFSDVEVPQGALVAAGEQAFETDTTIVVPSGSFDPFGGGITAGEERVTVHAAAPGPAANVPPGAIDTVLDPGLASALRGFPNITERLVENLDATSGGLDETGPEITQADLDDAMATLRDALAARVDEVLAESEAMPHADGEAFEAVIEGVDELVGRRDAETVEISGSLEYDRLVADPDEVTSDAIRQFAGDTSIVPAGWEIVAESTTVALGSTERRGDGLAVDASVRGLTTLQVELEAVLERAIGRSSDEAAAALSDLGQATVTLWPGWVSTVPGATWRIDLQVVPGEEG